jgi:hypothetical protein
MARFRCRVCGGEGEFDYRAGKHACPRCGSPDVQIAVSVDELPDDDPLFGAMQRWAQGDEEEG